MDGARPLPRQYRVPLDEKRFSREQIANTTVAAREGVRLVQAGVDHVMGHGSVQNKCKPTVNADLLLLCPGAGKSCRSIADLPGSDNGARLPGSVKAGSMTEHPDLFSLLVSAFFIGAFRRLFFRSFL